MPKLPFYAMRRFQLTSRHLKPVLIMLLGDLGRMLQPMARRIGATITEGQGSHAVFMSQAKAVAAVIDQAAHGTVPASARTVDSM
jgi:hypothetical protein